MPLKRDVGLSGAVMLGLGSIVGTGVFVTVGLVAGLAGQGVLVAIFLAAVVATCNGISSAQLAANHPVSGGTYEYGYHWCHPNIGFVAGWLFLCAKSASAAAAALGFATYVLQAVGCADRVFVIPLALLAIAGLTWLTLTGIRRSNRVNMIIVGITIGSLVVFILTGLIERVPVVYSTISPASTGANKVTFSNLFQAAALMFVAYTGYGRIATLGEEIKNPRQHIPIAIGLTLLVSMMLYLGVGYTILKWESVVAAEQNHSTVTTVMQHAAERFRTPGVAMVMLGGAVAAMLGVLLNLILGLSRVMLAMARRGDMPVTMTRIDESTAIPRNATIAVALIVAAIVLVGNIQLVWSFSAFTVLVYYAITNLCAIRMRPDQRTYPIATAWLGLSACLFLAFWVDAAVWIFGSGLIATGFMWRWSIDAYHRSK